MAMVADDFPFPCDTLYFGGGTPSLLPPADVARIVAEARDRFRLAADAEITLEANPGTLGPETLERFRRAGVNRLSLGVQSFDANQLRALGRIHAPAEAESAFRAARSAGFANIGLDLIYGLPGQTETDWRRDMERAVALAPEHLSCYLLTWAPGTPLHRDRRRGRIRPLPEHEAARLFDLTFRVLEDRGYPAYEISNFAREPRFRSRHNRKYWTHAPYLGLGPAAHGFIPPERRWNLPSVRAYIAALRAGRSPVSGRERLGPAELATEALYLGLRQAEGIDAAEWERRFGATFERTFAAPLETLFSQRWIEMAGHRFFLSGRGRRYLDGIVDLLASEIGAG
jgi:oxygen-independent coproporphyrinogen III oxidase